MSNVKDYFTLLSWFLKSCKNYLLYYRCNFRPIQNSTFKRCMTLENYWVNFETLLPHTKSMYTISKRYNTHVLYFSLHFIHISLADLHTKFPSARPLRDPILSFSHIFTKKCPRRRSTPPYRKSWICPCILSRINLH